MTENEICQICGDPFSVESSVNFGFAAMICFTQNVINNAYKQ